MRLTTLLEGFWVCNVASLIEKKTPVPVSVLSTVSILASLLPTFKYLTMDESIEQLDFPSSSHAQFKKNPFVRGNILKLNDLIEMRSKDKHISENYRLNHVDGIPTSIRLYVQLVDLEHELPHTRICDVCKSDLLNRFFHCSECILPSAELQSQTHSQGKFSPRFDGIDLCFECYGRGRFCKHPIMTLMQTFDTLEVLDELFCRANTCINNWASKISSCGIMGMLPSTTNDQAVLDAYLVNMGISPIRAKKSSGTVAFGVLLKRANGLMMKPARDISSPSSSSSCCFHCQRVYSSKMGEMFVDCSWCKNRCCYRCVWNLFASDPFEIIRRNAFVCTTCSPSRLSCLELACKKVDAILPWIGCASLGVFQHVSQLAHERFITPCFFDHVIAEATKRVSSKLAEKSNYKDVLLSYFQKSSETKFLKSSPQHGGSKKHPTITTSIMEWNGNSNVLIPDDTKEQSQHKILKLEVVQKERTDEDFGVHLSTKVDLGFGMAVKSLTRKKQSQKRSMERNEALLPLQSSSRMASKASYPCNSKQPLASEIQDMGEVNEDKDEHCPSKPQICMQNEPEEGIERQPVDHKKNAPRSSMPDGVFLACSSTSRVEDIKL